MRMLAEVRFSLAKFNAAVRDGSVGEKMKRILQVVQPEATYFTERGGKRGAIMIVNVDDPATVPKLAEPFFLEFDADVEFHVVMSPEDLQRASLEALGKEWA